MTDTRTPRADGFAMPAEWEPHQCCFMAWPTRQSLWGELFGQAKRDYAEVARTIAGFEPVVLICRPGAAAAAGEEPLRFSEVRVPEAVRGFLGPFEPPLVAVHPGAQAVFLADGDPARPEPAPGPAPAGGGARGGGTPATRRCDGAGAGAGGRVG